jgi:hypothetical protein
MRKPSCHCAEHWVASKRLSGFPTIRKAFKIIQADNGIDDKLINAAVPANWLKRFEIAEKVLRKVAGIKLADLLFTGREWSQVGEAMNIKYDTVLEHVSVPQDDEDFVILHALGTRQKTIRTVRAVLNEFFDGGLTNVFTED